MRYKEGTEVSYLNEQGTIHFICEKYITICIHKKEHKSQNVCLLVYPDQYNEIVLI